MSTVRKLVHGLKGKYVLCSILSPLFMIGEVIMEIFIPFVMSKIIDVGIAETNLSYVIKYGLTMILMAVISLSFGVMGTVCSTTAAQGFAANLRSRMFKKIQGFSFSNIDRFSTASLITRLTTDCNMEMNVYRMLIQMCIRAPFMMIAGTVMAFNINSKLAVIFLVAIPVIALSLITISSFAKPRFDRMMKKFDGMNGAIQENLIGIRVVKAYVRGDYEEEKFKKAASELKTAQVKAEKLIIFIIPILQLVMYLSMIAALWFGGRFVIFGTMKEGELISFFTYITQVLMSLMMLGMVFMSLVMVQASNRRIVEVLDEKPEIKSPETNAETDVDNGSVEFKDVSFSYSGSGTNSVLENINLNIKSGQTAGIIGGTGSSKTTLVSLIPRLYDTTNGQVFVGGKNVREYDLTSLRDSVAVVLQKNVLFSGSIKENLLWGNENATMQEIEDTCKAADADSFIKTFPDGYETELGQGGVNVSGGQKQRLCIARALLKKPKILILDDSTSAVDTATETRIRKSLKDIAPETTKIIIAQRISSVKDADIIFVMDNGKISGCGTHEELLASNKIYREVYDSQQQGSGDADLE